MLRYINLKCLFFFLLFSSLTKCGIPGLHKWLISNFPSCVKIVHKNHLLDINNFKGNTKISRTKKKKHIFEVDNLLFDLNQLLHKANVKFTSFDNYFSKLSSLIKNVLKKFHPIKNVVFAIDGICPFSKLKLQIKRRAKVKLQDNENSYICEQDKLMNDITCGSTFINKISEFLVRYVKYLSSLQKYENVKFFVSTDKEIGEGELKLMNWINSYVHTEKKKKKEKNENNINSNKEENEIKLFVKNKENKKVEEELFIIVGADADLLLQCLALNNIHNIYIYTYQTFNMNMCENKNKKENHLLKYKKSNFTKDNKDGLINNLKKTKTKVLYNLNIFINLFLNKYPQSFEFIKKDLLILFILKGNDYLPKIKEGNFCIFFEAYFKMLEKIKRLQKEEIYCGFLNKNYTLNKKNFLNFLNEVQKIINFSNNFLYYNNKKDSNNCNNSNMKNFKENNIYLPLSFLNELISKNIIEKNEIKKEIIKEKDLYKCTLTYIKNNKNHSYSAISKKKKMSIHIAAYSLLKDKFSSYLKYINSEVFDYKKKEEKEINKNSHLEKKKEDLSTMERESKISVDLENNLLNNEVDHMEMKKNGMNNEMDKTKLIDSNKEWNHVFNKNNENEDMRIEIYLKNFYLEKCKNELNYEEEKKIVENYIQGIHWVIEMYTNTYCINFNFFYKYLGSPSLLSLYYHISNLDELKSCNSDYRSIMKNVNLNIFKNNYEYYNFINFCVHKYYNLKIKLNSEEKEESKKNSLLIMNKNNKNFFENIYDILFSKNINTVTDNIKKLNETLKTTMHNRKIINYYWNIYSQKLKNFYKIIFYKGKKIYVSRFSLFEFKFLANKNNNSTYEQKLTKNGIYNNNEENIDIEYNDFDENLKNFKKSRIFYKNSLNYFNRKKTEKKVIKKKYTRIVYH